METRKKALKAQEASKDTSKAEWVMCSVCDSWAKLQDTAFSSIEEADAAPDYKCRQCTKLDSFREEMVTLVKQVSESNKLAIADLRMHLEEETATRRREGEHLEALLRVEKTRNAELATKVALLEQPNPSLTPISMMDSKGTEMTAQKTPLSTDSEQANVTGGEANAGAGQVSGKIHPQQDSDTVPTPPQPPLGPPNMIRRAKESNTPHKTRHKARHLTPRDGHR
ncbi:hypothetical protein MTO96_034553 [Rhipicephalus appendiculatus]